MMNYAREMTLSWTGLGLEVIVLLDLECNKVLHRNFLQNFLIKYLPFTDDETSEKKRRKRHKFVSYYSNIL